MNTPYDGAPVAMSRIRGRGAPLRSLHALVRRIERYRVRRARSANDRAWAGRFADRLEQFFTEALPALGAEARLRVAEHRAEVRRKALAAMAGVRR